MTSGLELSTRVLHEPSIRAEVTVTLAAPKTGLRGDLRVDDAVGELLLADNSVLESFSSIERTWHSPFGAGPLARIV